MNVHDDDLRLCQCCAGWYANGDLSGCASCCGVEHADDVERGGEEWAKMGCVVSPSGCADECDVHDDPMDCRTDDEFSARRCDGCGSHLAGCRTPAIALCEHEECADA